jgi:glycosyltransferase involved in cell wall biosynthesis
MNICLLTSTSLPLVGGLEIVVDNLATSLTNLGHKVYLVTPYPKFKKIADNCVYNYNVVRFGFRGCGRLGLTTATAVLTLSMVVKKYKIDVINVHNVFTPGTWSYFFSRINPSIPIIGTPHGDDIQITTDIQDGVRLDPQSDQIVRRNLNNFKCITAISASMHEDILSLVEKNKKIFFVPNGVWVKRFQSSVNQPSVRKKFNIPLDSIAIISIGRNHPRKGFVYGLEAIARLRSAGFNISYIIVGRYMEPLIEKAKALSISDVLITPGQVDAKSISELLQCSDIYLSPSIVESFGMATLEAMSAGLPSVVTDIAGSRDIVSADFGLLVKPKDPDRLSTALKYLIQNSSIRREMGRKAQKAADNYNWPNIAIKYLNVYSEAINN